MRTAVNVERMNASEAPEYVIRIDWGPVRKEAAMPTYEYTCKECGERFELALSLGDHEKKQKCPKCGSAKLEQRISSFTAMTSKKA